MLTYNLTNTANNHTLVTTELHKAIYFVRDELGITYPELAIAREILYQAPGTMDSYKSLNIAIQDLPVEPFVEAHRDVHNIKHIAVNGTAYKRLSISGKILEYWECDENHVWHDRTKKAQLQSEIADLKRKVSKTK